MSLRWVGRFQELGGGSAALVLRDNLGGASEAEASAVASYLRSGHGVIDVMEMQPDVIDGSDVAGTGSLVSDGVWLWREDLAHYVEKYRVALGDAFLSSIVGNVPEFSESDLSTVIQEALDLWQSG